MNDNIAVGDIVTVKSDGPKMTVNFEANDGLFNCVWFSKGELKSGQFSSSALTKVVD